MSDFLVVGGGLIGQLTVRELVQAGASVTLVDKGEAGGESSWAGGGILSPLYPWRYPESVTRLAAWSQRHYPALADELRQQSGVDPEYTPSGLLILDSGESGQARDWAADCGSELQVIDAAEIRRLEPGLAQVPDTALWLPQVAQVRNPRLVRALRLALRGGIWMVERSRVVELLIHKDRAVGVRTPTETLHADKLIVCAGAWTAELFAQLGRRPDIEPVRGQMLLFNARPGEVTRIVLQRDRYAIPRRDGRVLMGSTLEQAGFVKETTEDAREDLYLRARELFPALRRASIEKHWAGLRPGSPSGIPYIGAYPGIAGLYFNAGHFRNGVVLGPASARLMADIALEREPILPPAPYALEAHRG